MCVISDDCSRPAAVRRDPGGARRRPAVRALAVGPAARLLPQLRARAGAGAGRRALRRAGRPGRRLAPGQARDAARRARRRAARLQRPADRRRRTARSSPTRTGAGASNNHADLLSLLVANAVTGAASLFRRELLDDALPFPPAQFAHFHDHWMALVRARARRRSATSTGRSTTTSSTAAALGHATRRRPRAAASGWRSRARPARADPAVAHALLRRRLPAAAVRAPCSSCAAATRMAPRKRRALERFLRADALARDGRARWRCAALRELRAATAARRSAPSGCSRYAFAWRRLLAATARDRPQRGLRLDAVPPPALDPRPGARAPGEPELRAVAEKIAPLRLARARRRAAARQPAGPDDRPRSTSSAATSPSSISPAGSRSAGVRVRIVTVDPVGSLARGWQRELEAYSGLAGLFERVEVAFGREPPGLEVSRARRASSPPPGGPRTSPTPRCATLGGERFLYLIQEYEPFTFPMGSYAALADRVLPLPAPRAVLDRAAARLLPPPRARRLRGRAGGDATSVAFQNAITPVDPPVAAELRRARTRRLLFYARPEPHAARNMFELGVLGARPRARARRVRGGWELHGIGTVRAGAAARPRRRRRAAAAPARRAGRLRASAARARRRARADVHAAPEPRADRDGVGRDAGGDEHVREQDARRRWPRSRRT